ncbi:MAG: hypothetical protein H0V31_03970 [Acidobacteria bacterium]|jgi:hypothetical protein|nr:hypothetical protein [Acidobacteriota bacterium]
MAIEEQRITFSYQEIVECLIKKRNIHEGLWGISVTFALGAINVNRQENPDKYMPAAIIPVQEIGIQKYNEPSNLTLDASKVNPRPKKTNSRTKGKKID